VNVASEAPAGSMPETMGIFRIVESEGLIVFSEDEPVWGCRTRFSFRRVMGCWHVSIEGDMDNVPASFIVRAIALIEEVYGGNFKGRNGLDKP
jgi:hypothetical protein